ncbi:hypothetical protein C2138_07745 [Salinibacterium hongtaonis]|nr:hypothetical protein C2138_07745 [Salinibacterium hongtaonis]
MTEEGAVTVSMRVMSAGDGYRYLLRTVVVGDGKRSLSTPLTRYYSAQGTPPWEVAGKDFEASASAGSRMRDFRRNSFIRQPSPNGEPAKNQPKSTSTIRDLPSTCDRPTSLRRR